VTTLKRAGKILFASTRPVSYVADYRRDRIELTVSAPEPARITIARPGAGPAELTVAAGQQVLTIR
jgi:hypothetical protein